MLWHLISEYVLFERLFLVRTYAWYRIVVIELLFRVVVIIMRIHFYYFAYDCSKSKMHRKSINL
jgi:hypothetical protein